MPDEIKTVEETTDSTSEEKQTPVDEQPQDEDVSAAAGTEEEGGKKQVPYDRFKEVVDQRNKYKELVATMEKGSSGKKAVASKKTEEVEEDDPYAALEDKGPDVESIIDQKLSKIERKLDLDRTIAQNPDFFQYSDAIKAKIEENPNIGWQDAYKLAKFDVVHAQGVNQGRQQAAQAVEQKRKTQVESAVKTKARGASVNEINPLAKGPDGKFLYSTKELEDILPKSK